MSFARDTWSFKPVDGLNHQVVSVWYHAIQFSGAKDLNTLLTPFLKYPN